MSFASQYSSVPFCDPSLPHSQIGHLPHTYSLLPHRACFPQERNSSRPHQSVQASRAPTVPASYYFKTQHRADFQRAGRHASRPRAPPPSPCRGNANYAASFHDQAAISGAELNNRLREPNLQQDDSNQEDCQFDFNNPQHQPFSSLPKQQNRHASGRTPRFRFPHYGITPPSELVRKQPAHIPIVPKIPETPPEAVLQPSPTIYSTMSHEPAPSRFRWPKPSSAPLSLFPPPSPTDSMGSNGKPSLSSPTTSLRPSVYLQPQVSVFEDDEERLGLMDYLKLSLQGSRGQGDEKEQTMPPTRSQRRRKWKQLLCFCTGLGRKG